MRRHPDGRIAHGIAGDGVFVREADGTDRQVHPGGGVNGMPDWWGDRLIFVRSGTVWSSDPDGNNARQELLNGQPVPASHVYACPTGWAAWTPALGVRCSDGRVLANAVLLDVASDGTVLVGDDYQSGRGLSAYQLGDTSLWPLWSITNARPSTQWPYPQASCLDKDTACWTEGNVLKGTPSLPPGPRPPWKVLHPTLCRVEGVVCVTYLRAEDDAILGHPWDYRGMGVISTALPAYGPLGSGGTVLTLYWSTGPGERLTQIKASSPVPLSGFLPLEVPPVPVPDTFGPVSPALPEGAVIPDLAPYIVGDPALWPRTGTHPMHQVVDGALVHHLKFDAANFPLRDRYETWAITDGWVHHIEDASNDDPYSFTDTRWFPRRMQIGQAFLYDDGGEEALFKQRGTCAIINRVYFRNRSWLLAAWDQFDCGPDLGVRRVVCMVFDPTDGVWASDRGIELDYFAENVGWLRWEYHRSDIAMETGVPVFDARSLVARSDFYRLGGTAWVPTLTGCAPAPTEPAVKLPDAVWTRIQRFAEAYPPPQGDPGDAHDERCRVWTRCVCEQIRSEFGDEWGWKRASATRPPSKESIARQTATTLDGWALLDRAGTGAPVLSSDPEHTDLIAEGNQLFIPVSAVNRLTRTSIRPALPFVAGMSAFDLGARLDRGERAWFDDYAAGVPVLRVMVSRQSGPTPRTLAEGREQVELALQALQATNQKAYVTLLCDTKGYAKQDMTDHVRICSTILTQYAGAVVAVEIANEIGHPTQAPDLMDIDFLEALDALVDFRFPLAWGGEFEGGSFVDLHSDRGQTPEVNGAEMARRQVSSSKDVLDGEPLGIAEVGRTAGRQRTDDPDYARRQAVAAKTNSLGGTILHPDSGLTCDINEVGPVQREAKRLFLAEFVTVPVPPPGPLHPILDAPLTPVYPVGYQFFIANWEGIFDEAADWFRRHRTVNNIVPVEPADTDLGHGVWRGLNEGERWKTLRAAWEETWPGGAPR